MHTSLAFIIEDRPGFFWTGTGFFQDADCPVAPKDPHLSSCLQHWNTKDEHSADSQQRCHEDSYLSGDGQSEF